MTRPKCRVFLGQALGIPRLFGLGHRRVDGGAAEAWATDVAAEHGFSDVSHTIEIFGVCQPCRTKD